MPHDPMSSRRGQGGPAHRIICVNADQRHGRDPISVLAEREASVIGSAGPAEIRQGVGLIPEPLPEMMVVTTQRCRSNGVTAETADCQWATQVRLIRFPMLRSDEVPILSSEQSCADELAFMDSCEPQHAVDCRSENQVLTAGQR